MFVIFGFFVMVFMFFFVGKLSGMLLAFIDVPSVILIIIPLIFFLFVSKNGNIIGSYFKSSFKKAYVYTKDELESISVAMKNTIKFTLAVGVFGFITGLIACLGYLGTPERIGPNLAISLCTLIYSIAISFFVFFPTQAWAETKINTVLNKNTPTGT